MSTEDKLRRALEELVDIVEGVIASGRATGLVDSFTLQPAREALAATQEQREPVKPPTSLHWLGDRERADAAHCAEDERGCVMYFANKDECSAFMEQLTHAAHDEFGVSHPISISAVSSSERDAQS